MRVFPTILHKTSALLLLSITVCLLTAAVSADEALCLQAVENSRYERISTVCINLPHRDRLKKMQLMMSGNYQHFLGTVDQPSAAFQLLKAHADGNDIQAMYMYGLLYSTVHIATDLSWPTHYANNGQQSMDAYNVAIRKEAAVWAKKAADRGHSLAMLDVAESMLRDSFANDTVDLNEALDLAAQAKQRNALMADDLIERITERIKKLREGQRITR